MVLAAPEAAPPSPICILRLLVTRDEHVLAVEREDGQGLDIPSARRDDTPVPTRLQGLMLDTFGAVGDASLLGYVRNVVRAPAGDYPWPVPDAYFAVWHVRMPVDGDVRGRWLAAGAARAAMGERHWWPLAAHVLGTA